VSLGLSPLDARLALKGLLGAGGMAEVHRAWDAHLERAVAVKLLRGGGGQEAERVLLEARLQARVEHRHVVKVHEVGTLGGRPCIVLQLVDGRTLGAVGPELPLAARVELVRQAAEGLEAAHRQGLVHRDVKPANVLVEEGHGGERTAYLTDFGLARDEEAAHTRTGLPPGTIDYMSPEQLTRSTPVDFRSDVYGLGATLYEVIACRPPFRATGEGGGEAETRLVRRILEEDPEPLWRAARGVPRDLGLIAARALEKEPADRYPSADALADDLGRWLRNEPVAARRAPPAERALRWARRNRALARVLAAAFAAVLLSLAGGYAATLRQWRRAEAEHREAERRFDEVRRLAGSLLFEVHDAIARLPGSTRARELIVQRAVEYLDRLSASSVDDAVRAELVEGYLRLARIQGVQGLGDAAAAVESSRKAVALAEALAAAPGAPPARRRLLPHAQRLLAHDLASAGSGEEAAALLARGSRALEALLAAEPESAGLLRDLADVRWDEATGRVDAKDWPGARRDYERAVDLYQRVAAAEPDRPVHRRNVALSLRNLAGVSLKLGLTDDARRFAEEAVSLDRALTGADPDDAGASGDLAISLASVAEADLAASSLDGALAGYREALEIHRRLAEADPDNGFLHTQCADDLEHLAALAVRRSRRDEAVELQRAAVAEWQRAAAGGLRRWSLKLGEALLSLGDLLGDGREAPGARDEACRAWRRCQEVLSGLPGHPAADDRALRDALRERAARCRPPGAALASEAGLGEPP